MKKRGLSLVEIMIYLAILSAALLLFVNLLTSISKSYISIRMIRKLDSAGISAMDRVTREIRNASSVDASSILGINPGTLILNTLDSSGSPTQIVFSVLSSQLHVTEAGVDSGSLFPTGITAPSLIFSQINTGVSRAIKIEMKIENEEGNTVRDQNYYSTIILRGSY